MPYSCEGTALSADSALGVYVKLDIGLGVEGKYLPNIGRLARAAEELGFAGLWSSETKHDPFLPLLLAAEHTSAIALGTSVALAFGRSPMITAQTAWDKISAVVD